MITATATLTSTISVTAILVGSLANTCASATIELNGVQVATVPSGETLDIDVVDTSNNPRGALNAGKWQIEKCTTEFNGVSMDSILPETGKSFTITRDGGAASGTKVNDTTWNVDSAPCPPVASVALTISDTTPNLGDIITLTATVSNFTPTSYIFYSYDGSTLALIIEQAGAVYNWAVNRVGTYDVFVVAVNATDAVSDFLEVTATSVYMLDQIASTPQLAFSVRRLRAAYTGNAALVRRSSDNTTLAIGFIGEDMDTASLIAFVGVGNGFTATFYNQMGSNDASQATAGNQPSLVATGVVILLNSRPTILFDNGNELLALTNTTVSHCFTVAKANSIAASTGQYIAGGTDQGFGIAGSAVSGIFIYNTGAILQTTIKNTTAHQISFRCGSGVSRIRVDGTTEVTGSIAALTINAIGSRQDIPFNADSRISEFITFSSNIPGAQELIIEANQKAYYGTP